MISYQRRCWAEINLDAVCHNFSLVQQKTGRVPIMAVVKADAYGHGDIAVAKALAQAGARQFAVASYPEAIRLRKNGIQHPILILGYTDPQYVSSLCQWNLSQCVMNQAYAKALLRAAQQTGTTVDIQIKLDTGMGRIGFDVVHNASQSLKEIQDICQSKEVRPVGIFTHFAVADSIRPDDIAYTHQQFADFLSAVASLRQSGLVFPNVHCCNSAATLAYPAMHLDSVRPGIILYGCNPSSDVTHPQLQPVMQLKTVVTMVKEIPAGQSINYGRTYIAPEPMRVATLAVGYADGYCRELSNQGVAGIHGQPAPVLGRVCMDQLVVDVSSIPSVAVGDQATVFGGSGADSIDDIARKCNTINYEILCNISKRVPRVYMQNNQIHSVTNYQEDFL